MKANLNAVYDSDLIALLKKFNLYVSVINGTAKCKFTNTTITFENLHSIIPDSGSIKLVCDNPEAIKLLSEYINDKGL